MLSLPRYTRSLLDTMDDDFFVYPLDYLMPRSFQQDMNRTRAQFQQQLSVPTIKDNKFNLNLDLRHFDPSEINVKFDHNSLQVSGKREKKSEDGKHYEFREYQHHFTVPDKVDHEQLKCNLDEKGYLKIEAPVKGKALDDKPRSIPIEFVKK